jgi:hypothetical protein
MKLTQKTLFQCFEKSRPQLPTINSLPSKINQILFNKDQFPLFRYSIGNTRMSHTSNGFSVTYSYTTIE